MTKQMETKQQELARLQKELADLKKMLPEHCSGREGYIDVHRASSAHWLKIEETEEQIEKLKAELGL